MKISWRRIVLFACLLLACSVTALAEQPLRSEAGPTFHLAAHGGQWSLVAYGDQRFTDPTNVKATNPTARQTLVKRIAEEKPDAVLMNGDVPYNGANADDYKVYRAETEPWRAAGLHIYPALGNHELHGGDSLENWWNAFPELRNRRWYSVEFGEAYLIVLDSDLELTAKSQQSNWLAAQLASLPRDTRYVFVALHHPPVADSIQNNPSHDVRPNEAALAAQLEAAAGKIHARIVVTAGHIHAYQRFERNGVYYLVTGGGGAAQHKIERTPADLYQKDLFPNFHYVKFTGDKHGLKAEMFLLDEHGKFAAGDSFIVAPAK